MDCKNIFFTVMIIILSILVILFLVLWIFQFIKCSNVSSMVIKQNDIIKNLNDRIFIINENYKNFKVEKSIEDEKMFVFGLADNISIICKNDEKVNIKSLYTKVVDDINNDYTEIIDLSKYIPAFSSLNNKQVVNYPSKNIVDNLKISIPYSLPTDNVVKTRLLFGSYTCKLDN